MANSLQIDRDLLQGTPASWRTGSQPFWRKLRGFVSKKSKGQRDIRYGGAMVPELRTSPSKKTLKSLYAEQSGELGSSKPPLKPKASKFSMNIFPARNRKNKADEKGTQGYTELDGRASGYWSDSTLLGSGSESIGRQNRSRNMSELSSDTECGRSRLRCGLGTLHELPESPRDEAHLSRYATSPDENVYSRQIEIEISPRIPPRCQDTPSPECNLRQDTEPRSKPEQTSSAPTSASIDAEQHRTSSHCTTAENLMRKSSIARLRSIRWVRTPSLVLKKRNATVVSRSSSSATSSSTITAVEQAGTEYLQRSQTLFSGASKRITPQQDSSATTRFHYHCLVCPWPGCNERLQELDVDVTSHFDSHLESARSNKEKDDYSCSWPGCLEPFTFKDEHVMDHHLRPLACRATHSTPRSLSQASVELERASPHYIRVFQRASSLNDQINSSQRQLQERSQRCPNNARCNHLKANTRSHLGEIERLCEREDELARMCLAMDRIQALPTGLRLSHCPSTTEPTWSETAALVQEHCEDSAVSPSLDEKTSAKSQAKVDGQIRTLPSDALRHVLSEGDSTPLGGVSPLVVRKEDPVNQTNSRVVSPLTAIDSCHSMRDMLETTACNEIEQNYPRREQNSPLNGQDLQSRLQRLQFADDESPRRIKVQAQGPHSEELQSQATLNWTSSSVQTSCTTDTGGSSPSTSQVYSMTGGANTGHSTQKRSRKYQGDRHRPYDKESEDEDNEEPRQQKKTKVSNSQATIRRFACPFYQRDPHLHACRPCNGPGYKTFHHMRSADLGRKHRVIHTCFRCWTEFKSQQALQVHLQLEISCRQRERPNDHRVDDQLWAELTKKANYAQAKNDEEKWVIAYKMLFPEDTTIPSPYFSPPTFELSSRYQDLLMEERAAMLSQALGERFPHMTANDLADITNAVNAVDYACRQRIQTMLDAEHRVLATPDSTTAPSSSSESSAPVFELDSGLSSASRSRRRPEMPPSSTSSLPGNPDRRPVSPVLGSVAVYVTPDQLHMPVPKSAIPLELNEGSRLCVPDVFSPIDVAGALYSPPMLHGNGNLQARPRTPASRPRSRATIGVPRITTPNQQHVTQSELTQPMREVAPRPTTDSTDTDLLGDLFDMPEIMVDEVNNDACNSSANFLWNMQGDTTALYGQGSEPDSGIGMSTSAGGTNNILGLEGLDFNCASGMPNSIFPW